MRIFISYGKDDALDLAREVAARLKADGFEPWLDMDGGIPPGAPFDVRIEDGIDACDMVLALLSPSSVRHDGFCRKELLYAQYKKRLIVPVRIADVTAPIQIINLSYEDFSADPRALLPQLGAILHRARGEDGFGKPEATATHPALPRWIATERDALGFEEELARHGQSFTGREWLFDETRRWIENPAARLLLITGDAGFGKSAIAAQLTTRFDVRSVHFCSRSQTESCKPRAWLMTVVRQLAMQLPAYRDAVADRSPNWNDSPESLFRTLVTDPLRRLDAPPSTDAPWVFVVDALDESVAEAGFPLAELLADSAERLPEWLRIIATSRPDGPILARFQLNGIQRKHLDAEGQPNLEDIRRYTHDRVARLEREGRIPHRDTTAATIAERAAGIFLFACLTLDALADPNPGCRLDLDAIGALPARLGGLYHAMFRKRFRNMEGYRRDVVPLLECLVAARDPLPRDLLRTAAGLDEGAFNQGRHALSQFLSGGTAGCRVFHQSLADWLADSDASVEFAVVPSEGHDRLRAACLAEYREKGASRTSLYTVRHLPTHLVEARQWDQMEKVLTDLAFLEAKVAAGMTFDLAGDFDRAVRALPPERPARRILKLLDEAIRRDLHFIARHAADYPQALFQCVWNHGWWYDSDEAAAYYEGGIAPGRLPSHGGVKEGWIKRWCRFFGLRFDFLENIKRSGYEGNGDGAESGRVPGRLCELLERWRAERERAAPGFAWVRSRCPPPIHLGTALRAVLQGHESAVKSVAFSPDGRRIVSGSGDYRGKDNTVRVWDTESGAELAILRGHEGWVMSVAFSPDGRRIASGSGDRTIWVWDAGSGAEIAVLRGHEGWVLSVAFSPNGRRIVSGSHDNTVRVWDEESRAELAVLRGHEDTINSVAFSPDGQRIVSGSDDKTVRVWDAESGAEVAVLRGHKDSVQSVAFSPDGQKVYSVSCFGDIQVWDASLLSEFFWLYKSYPIIHSTSMKLKECHLVAASDDKTIHVRNTEHEHDFSLKFENLGLFNINHCFSIDIGPDALLIVGGYMNGTIHIMETKRGGEVAVLGDQSISYKYMTFNPDKLQIVYDARRNKTRIWDFEKAINIASLSNHKNFLVNAALSIFGDGAMRNCVTFSPGGRMISFVTNHRTIRVLDTKNWSEMASMRRKGKSFLDDLISSIRGRSDCFTRILFSPSGRRLASASLDNTLRVWDIEGKIDLTTMRGHNEYIRCVEFSPDERRIVSGSDDKTVRVWDAESGAELAVLRGHEDLVNNVAFSPDGRRIVSGSNDNTIRVWDAENGNELAVLQEPGGSVEKVAFSQDGRRIVSGSRNAPVRVWDVESGECLEVIEGWGDVHAIAATAAMLPWRALGHENEQETVVERSETGAVVARFPTALFNLSTYNSGRNWIGFETSHHHIYLLTLEGPAS